MARPYSAAGDDRDYEDKIIEGLKKKQASQTPNKQVVQPIHKQGEQRVSRWAELDTAQCKVTPPAELSEDTDDDGTMAAGIAIALIDGRDFVQYVEISAETNETLWMRGDTRTWVQASAMDIGVEVLGIRFHRGFLRYAYAAIFFFLLSFVTLYMGSSSNFITNAVWISSIALFAVCCNKAVKNASTSHWDNSGWVKISQQQWREFVRNAARSYEDKGSTPADIRRQLDENLRQTRDY